jgi:hypothetical protein
MTPHQAIFPLDNYPELLANISHLNTFAIFGANPTKKVSHIPQTFG